jgi:hypothetical protein
VTVVILITAYMVNDNLQYGNFVNASSDGFRILLLNDNYDTLQGKTRVYNYAQLQTTVQTATTNYFGYPSTCLYPITVESEVIMNLVYLNDTSIEFRLTAANPLGPFADPDSSSSRYLLNDLREINVLYPFQSVQSSYSGSGQYADLLYKWDCVAIYDFGGGGGSISYWIDISARVENSDHSILMKLDICIIIVVIFSGFLTYRAFLRSYRVFSFARDALSRKFTLGTTDSLMWKDLKLRDKLVFFNLWYAAFPFLLFLMPTYRHFSTMLSGIWV